MRTADAIRHFGSQHALAKALKIKQPSVADWGDYPPDRRQLQIERITGKALKAEPEAKLSPAEKLELRVEEVAELNIADAKLHAKAAATEKRAEARAKGYEGEACGECGNFTLVRNGTCMKCDTCGSTTGCS